MPEIIDINKHLSYGKDKKKKEKKRKTEKKGVVNSSVFSFLDRSLISVGVFNYYLPLLCAWQVLVDKKKIMTPHWQEKSRQNVFFLQMKNGNSNIHTCFGHLH